MASKRTHDVVATLGEYKTAGGETKKRYTNIGTGFTDEQHRISIKLDTIPVSPDWSGWVSLYPIKDRDDQQSDRRQPQQQRETPRNHAVPDERRAAQDDDDQEIPF